MGGRAGGGNHRADVRAFLGPSLVRLGPVGAQSCLAAMHSGALLASRPPSATRGIHVRLPGRPLVIHGARVDLLHALDNILANAENHAGGASAMRVRRIGDRVEIVVEDQGPGVPDEHLPRLTERFYRVNVADSRSRGGTGLGLAIVKHVVSRHKGELRIESEPGAGSRFTLRFDLAGDRD